MKRSRQQERATGCCCTQATQMLGPWCDPPHSWCTTPYQTSENPHQAHTQTHALPDTPSCLETTGRCSLPPPAILRASPHPTSPSHLPMAPRQRGKATSSGLSPREPLAEDPWGGTGF